MLSIKFCVAWACGLYLAYLTFVVFKALLDTVRYRIMKVRARQAKALKRQRAREFMETSCRELNISPEEYRELNTPDTKDEPYDTGGILSFNEELVSHSILGLCSIYYDPETYPPGERTDEIKRLVFRAQSELSLCTFLTTPFMKRYSQTPGGVLALAEAIKVGRFMNVGDRMAILNDLITGFRLLRVKGEYPENQS